VSVVGYPCALVALLLDASRSQLSPLLRLSLACKVSVGAWQSAGTMTYDFDGYLAELSKTPFDDQTEHTGRSALEGLLNEFATASPNRGITVQHEPKRVADKGHPISRFPGRV
jgi:hypothetical protein